ncbi:anion permease [Propionibacterium freudenreichii]|nr:anion permease [Propionibacterium freudenreichii]
MLLIPTPGGLEPRAWHMLALFVATIVAIIAKVMPMGAVCLVARPSRGCSGSPRWCPARATSACSPASPTPPSGSSASPCCSPGP